VQRVVDVVVPHGVEPVPARSATGRPRVVVVALGDHEHPPRRRPAAWAAVVSCSQKGHGGRVDDGVDRVEPEAVDVEVATQRRVLDT
jgi:hypothetical protein